LRRARGGAHRGVGAVECGEGPRAAIEACVRHEIVGDRLVAAAKRAHAVGGAIVVRRAVELGPAALPTAASSAAVVPAAHRGWDRALSGATAVPSRCLRRAGGAIDALGGLTALT